MKAIRIEDLVVGNRYTKPIYLDNENVFINANTPITENDLQKLKKNSIKEVFSDGEKISDKSSSPKKFSDSLPADPNKAILKLLHMNTEKSRTEFENVYKTAFLAVQDFYRKFSEDRQADVNSIRTAGDKIYDFTKVYPNFPYLLLNHREEGYYLYNHSVKATFYTMLIAYALDFSKPRALELAFSSLIADCGMAKVPSNISEKKGTLTESEYKIVQKHTVTAYQYLTKVMKLRHNQAVVSLQHHENYDGTGYPSKINKTEIDEITCIYSLADNFSALISDRPWRKKFLPYDAMKTMISVTMNKFDLNILRIFLNKISIYPVGSFVELSDGSIAKVLEANNTKMLRPSIYTVKDSSGNPPLSEQYFNLALENDITITKAVDHFPI
jgi:HD-GYP domain-containing protein (c-di-GMP phosphodiesterase class II)